MFYVTPVSTQLVEDTFLLYFESLAKNKPSELTKRYHEMFVKIIEEMHSGAYFLYFNSKEKTLSAYNASLYREVKKDFDHPITAFAFMDAIEKNLFPSIKTEEKKVSEPEAIQKYIHELLRKHTEFLLSELSLNQYPKDTVRATTERFIIEKLQ